MKIDKLDIVHSLYNAVTVGYDDVNGTYTAADKDGKAITVVPADVDAEYDKQQYKNRRVEEYPSWEDQMDKIYHSGIDAWKADIKAIKDKYPKP